MTVAKLIEILKAYPQDLEVIYMCKSEYDSLNECDLEMVDACIPRPDGWIQNKRPDKETRKYLAFPGN